MNNSELTLDQLRQISGSGLNPDSMRPISSNPTPHPSPTLQLSPYGTRNLKAGVWLQKQQQILRAGIWLQQAR